ncbi:MAG: MlaD family protein [Gemmatimonadales bacterium]
MDLYYKKEIGVGLLVLVALAVLGGGMLWFNGRDFGGGRRTVFQVQLNDASGLKEGDPVQISGVSVGRVRRVRLESPGRVLVRLEVVRGAEPHADATVRIAAIDFFGAQRVVYDPGTSASMLAPDEVLIAVREEAMMDNAAVLADQAAEVLSGLQRLLSEETTTTLIETMETVQLAMDVIARYDNSPLVREATETMTALQSIATSIDSTLGNPAIDRSVAQLDDITESLREMADGFSGAAQSLSVVMERIASSEGSVGRAINDTTLVTDVHDVMTSLRLLLDDIRERPQRYIHVRASIF